MSSAMESLLTDKQWAMLMDEVERGVDEGSWYMFEEEEDE